MASKHWRELSSRQRGAIVFLGTVELGLLLAALSDIYRRPKERIRGSRWLWTLAAFVNFVGPAGYFLFGRKR